MQRLAGFSRIFWLGAVLGTTGAEGFAQTASPEGTIALPEIEVVATSPLPGGGENRDKIPAQVQSVPAEDFARTNSPSVTDTLQQQVPAAVSIDINGNPFSQDLFYRPGCDPAGTSGCASVRDVSPGAFICDASEG
jgi:iron complex outermembrane recepter protein